MGKVIPFRRASRKSRRAVPWSHPAASDRPRSRAGNRGARWFGTALVVLPLAAFTGVLLMPLQDSPRKAAGAVPLAGTGDREQARFDLCSGPVRVTCVVDGDTIWYQGEKIRIADLDTPEVSSPGCPAEAELGRKATLRLLALLNAGPFTIAPNPEGQSKDRYGRSLMLVTRDGESIGSVLVREGLAERWGGPRRAWCDA